MAAAALVSKGCGSRRAAEASGSLQLDSYSYIVTGSGTRQPQAPPPPPSAAAAAALGSYFSLVSGFPRKTVSTPSPLRPTLLLLLIFGNFLPADEGGQPLFGAQSIQNFVIFGWVGITGKVCRKTRNLLKDSQCIQRKNKKTIPKRISRY